MCTQSTHMLLTEILQFKKTKFYDLAGDHFFLTTINQ